jgi:hypothetical protein
MRIVQPITDGWSLLFVVLSHCAAAQPQPREIPTKERARTQRTLPRGTDKRLSHKARQAAPVWARARSVCVTGLENCRFSRQPVAEATRNSNYGLHQVILFFGLHLARNYTERRIQRKKNGAALLDSHGSHWSNWSFTLRVSQVIALQ